MFPGSFVGAIGLSPARTAWVIHAYRQIDLRISTTRALLTRWQPAGDCVGLCGWESAVRCRMNRVSRAFAAFSSELPQFTPP